MTDQTENPTGTQAQPTPAASAATSSLNVDELVKVLGPAIEAIVDRKTQSVKDKRIAGLQGSVDEFKNQLAELKALQGKGWTEAQALDLLELRSNNRPAAQPAEPQPKANGTSPQAANLETIISAFGLQPNDAEVTAILRDTPDPFAQTTRLAALAVQKKSSPPPNPAQMQPGTGGAAHAAETRESVTQELNKLLATPNKSDAQWNQMDVLQEKLKNMR